MAKRIWKCIIPGCTSPARAPGHYFPKNNILMNKWLESIAVPWIQNMREEEIRKCRICYLHFTENSYIFTLNRRRLKHDAIPTLNLSERFENDIPQLSTNQVQEENITFETNMNIDTLETETQQETQQEIQQETQQEIQQETQGEIQQETQQLDPEIVQTPKSNRTNHSHRNILGSITRKNQLTPIAKRLYDANRKYKKQNNALHRNRMCYKQRLKDATKFASLNFFKQYTALNITQKMFIDMQLKNIRQKPQVNFSMFCTKLKSALKSICNDDHASVYLENMGIDAS